MPVPHVSIRPQDNQPCFEGSRTPVDALFVNLAAGERLESIVENCPGLTRDAAIAVLREACRAIRERAMIDAGVAPEAQARAGALMFLEIGSIVER